MKEKRIDEIINKEMKQLLREYLEHSNKINLDCVVISYEDVEKAFFNKEYIVDDKSIYQPKYSYDVGGFYADKIYSFQNGENVNTNGNVYTLKANDINKALGYNLLPPL